MEDTQAVGGAVDEPAARRGEQRGWYWYDWANSVYSTAALTVFLGPYLTSVTTAAADADGLVHPLGIPVRAGSFYPYEISDRGVSGLGPLVFGVTYQLTGSYRDAIMSLVAFFLIGFALLARVPVGRAIAAAGNPVPDRI